MQRWLIRLAFSFIIIGCVLTWEGYRIWQGRWGPGHESRMWLYFIGAACSFGMGILGVREKHRRS